MNRVLRSGCYGAISGKFLNSLADPFAAFNKIQSKHLDFVVCDPDDLSIQFVIELDDKSHAKAKRQSRDEFVNQALAAAGVPLSRFPVKRTYSVQDIQNEIF